MHIVFHSFWRTSSTYLWAKFRELPEALTYYEPFHGILSGHVFDRSDSSSGWNSRHPHSIKYFREIVAGYRSQGIDKYPQNNGEWDDREYFYLSQSQEIHVRSLCRAFEACGDKSICCWFFNRGVAKISSIHQLIERETGGEVVSILLCRDPLQQFSSYIYQSSLNNLWFESRFYRQWLQGAIAPDLAPWGLCSDGRISCEIVQEILCDVMTSMASRVNLTCYLYAFSTLKSLALSVGTWECALGEEFDRRHHFLIDNFARCGPDRESFIDLIKDFSPSLGIDDWHLPLQKNSIVAGHLVSAFRCACSSLQPLILAMPNTSVLKGFARKISAYTDLYHRLSFDSDFCPRMDEVDHAFMDSVKLEAEDFALIADNRQLVSQLQGVREEKEREVGDLRREQVLLSAQVQNLQKACQEQATLISVHEEDKARDQLAERVETLEVEKADAAKTVEDLKQQLGLQSAQLQEALDARDQLAERIETLKAEKADAAKTAEDLKQQLGLQSAQLQKALEARDQQAEKVETLEADSAKAAEALQRLRQLAVSATP